jgi:hypothetical protein
MYTPQDALNSAKNSESLSNYPAIFAGFAARDLTDIRPRENVFTYKAWQALGAPSAKRGKGSFRLHVADRDQRRTTNHHSPQIYSFSH